MIQNKEREKMGNYAHEIYKEKYTFNKMINNIEKEFLY
jgi:glycerol dehydrogenase-like iron-containing ADH family enzyme